ncbi:MAG TPA: hypothetical protein PLP23_08110 [Panacibacter sp.]|nr:hypothetical protein [Panacibacter sp.]
MGRGFHLTIDEWFYYWFADDAKIADAVIIFDKMFEVCDKIVIQRESRLAKRFHELFEASSMYPPIQRAEVKRIMKKWLTNPLKIYWVEKTEELSEALVAQLPSEDIYIVKICAATTDKIFITTDKKLFADLLRCKPELGISPYMADDFIKAYPDFQ